MLQPNDALNRRARVRRQGAGIHAHFNLVRFVIVDEHDVACVLSDAIDRHAGGFWLFFSRFGALHGDAVFG